MMLIVGAEIFTGMQTHTLSAVHPQLILVSLTMLRNSGSTIKHSLSIKVKLMILSTPLA